MNQPVLFAEPDRPDVCTDIGCWRSKVVALGERERREVFAAGGTVLLEEEVRRALNGGATPVWNSPWIDLDAACHLDPERRTWRELLGDFCPPPALAFTAAGKPIRLARKDETLDALARNGIDLSALGGREGPVEGDAGARFDGAVEGSRPAQDPADARRGAEIARATRQRLLAAIVAGAETSAPEDQRFVSLVFETILHGGYHNAVVDTVKRRLGRMPKGEQPTVALAEIATALDGAALRGLVLELCLSRGSCFAMAGEKYPRDFSRALEAYGIDADAIERTVAEELTVKRAARAGA